MLALTGLQNFIRLHSPETEILFWERQYNQDRKNKDPTSNIANDTEAIKDDKAMSALRDRIADEMWGDYQKLIRNRY